MIAGDFEDVAREYMSEKLNTKVNTKNALKIFHEIIRIRIGRKERDWRKKLNISSKLRLFIKRA